MNAKTKVQKKSPEVTPVPSPKASSLALDLSLAELGSEAAKLVSLAQLHQVDMTQRNWTPALTDEVSTDLEAFNDARNAWLAERDLRKDSTAAFRGEVQVARSYREGLVASLRFIGLDEATVVGDARFSGRVNTPKRLARWLTDATSLVQKHEQELIACGFATDPVAEITARASALTTATGVQDQNQASLPGLAKVQRAARATLVSSMERLRRAGLMTFAGNKAVSKEFRRDLKRKKAKAAKVLPGSPAAPTPPVQNAAKQATSPASDAAKPAS